MSLFILSRWCSIVPAPVKDSAFDLGVMIYDSFRFYQYISNIAQKCMVLPTIFSRVVSIEILVQYQEEAQPCSSCCDGDHLLDLDFVASIQT